MKVDNIVAKKNKSKVFLFIELSIWGKDNNYSFRKAINIVSIKNVYPIIYFSIFDPKKTDASL